MVFSLKIGIHLLIGKVADRKKNPLDILNLSNSSTEQHPIELKEN